jgi:DNA segregation ATPase FtsK/SpoIIIE-like protein
MVMVEQRAAVPVPERVGGVAPIDEVARADDADERRLRMIAVGGAGVFAAILVAFWVWWPGGVVLGLVVGTLAVLHVGRIMHASGCEDSADGLGDPAGEEELRQEFARLRVSLGDDWPTFRRAAVLITRAQWASVAGLQRELGISTGTAQHIMGQLEREGFVGPSRGSRPRVVRLPRERAGELEMLMRS